MTSLSYSTVVLYVGIIKVLGFLPKNPTYKPAKYLLCDSMAALVRHSQAQKCFYINVKPYYKFLTIFNLTHFSTD